MTRIASAAVLAALLILTIWWLPWWATMTLAAIAAALSAAEVAGLSAAVGATVAPAGLGVAAAAVSVAFAIHDGNLLQADALVPVVLAVVIGAGLVALASGPPSPAALTRAAVLVMAPLYVGLPIGALAWMARSHGPAALTWLIVVIAASDSAQYYTGRAFGRRKLAPAVSPAKTVEGAIGGIVVAAVAAVGAGIYWLPEQPTLALAILGVLLAAFGMAGDLFESLLKRSAGVKDSSTLIPGHGGVLDRIDALLFAVPAYYLYLRS